jgi:hypothetical protein
MDQFIRWISSNARPPVEIGQDHVLDRRPHELSNLTQEHYFRVVINQVFQVYKRRWWSSRDLIVFVAIRYWYANSEETFPFLLTVPEGASIENRYVSSLLPFLGGPLDLTVVFRPVSSSSLLYATERLSGVLIDPSTDPTLYPTLASAVVERVEALVRADSSTPIGTDSSEFMGKVQGMSCRAIIDAPTVDSWQPAYYALIAGSPMFDYEYENFWVRDGRLFYGKSGAEAYPYADNDFVLFSIARFTSRADGWT